MRKTMLAMLILFLSMLYPFVRIWLHRREITRVEQT